MKLNKKIKHKMLTNSERFEFQIFLKLSRFIQTTSKLTLVSIHFDNSLHILPPNHPLNKGQ